MLKLREKTVEGLFNTLVTFETSEDFRKFFGVFSNVDSFGHTFVIKDNQIMFIDDLDEHKTLLGDLIQGSANIAGVKIVSKEDNLNPIV